jgi:hypothetical protein
MSGIGAALSGRPWGKPCAARKAAGSMKRDAQSGV